MLPPLAPNRKLCRGTGFVDARLQKLLERMRNAKREHSNHRSTGLHSYGAELRDVLEELGPDGFDHSGGLPLVLGALPARGH